MMSSIEFSDITDQNHNNYIDANNDYDVNNDFNVNNISDDAYMILNKKKVRKNKQGYVNFYDLIQASSTITFDKSEICKWIYYKRRLHDAGILQAMMLFNIPTHIEDNIGIWIHLYIAIWITTGDDNILFVQILEWINNEFKKQNKLLKYKLNERDNKIKFLTSYTSIIRKTNTQLKRMTCNIDCMLCLNFIILILLIFVLVAII